ncbi:MAG TPA: hypothetical protein VMM78_03610 [Thermomicrobiales bacterium]|nr:hypothetical protein [Thermomicrobiales bacterium]
MGNARELAIVTVVSFSLASFGLRALLALLDVHTWTVAWRVVELPTMIVVVPLERWGIMERVVIGRLNIAELTAALLVSGVSIVVLSSLANRRR